jgi:hypothetical protein
MVGLTYCYSKSMTKTKDAVDLDEIYNFIVDTFFL